MGNLSPEDDAVHVTGFLEPSSIFLKLPKRKEEDFDKKYTEPYLVLRSRGVPTA